MKLLLADNDGETLDLVRSTFMPDGFLILRASDADSASTLFSRESPDLVLINPLLSGGVGMELLGEIRRQGTVPIVLLTTRTDEDHVVEAFQRGADDLLIKPLRARELQARAHALLRRAEMWKQGPDGHRRLELGHITLDPRTRRVTVDGQTVHLSRTEFALLEYLMRNHDSVVRLPQLVVNVWGYDGTENENVVKVAISRLRRKLAVGPAGPRHIVNVPGVGYMFQKETASVPPPVQLSVQTLETAA